MSGPHVLTLAEVEAAADEYGANCGPAALAAVLGLSLAEIRPHLGDFEAKGYMNPTMMLAALRSLGVKWEVQTEGSFAPDPGICRVQWEGPWTAPGVPVAARYRHTHWIGTRTCPTEDYGEIFDVNAVVFPVCVGGWLPMAAWTRELVPHILRLGHPKATGWSFTHRLQIVSGPAGAAV